MKAADRIAVIRVLYLIVLCLMMPALRVQAASGAGAKLVHACAEPECIGDDIPFSSWIDPQVQPWAVLLCVHGLSLHANSYEAFGKRMAAEGVPTYAIDVRGFGSWQNTKETQRVNFKAALTDIHCALESLRAAHPDLPVVLAGESMGGALALQAAAENQSLIDGLICSVPASKRSGQGKTTARVAVGLLTSPHRQMNAGPDVVHRATKNPALVEAWMDNDAMARMNLSAKELLDFARFTSHNGTAAAKVATVPVLFLQGARDKLIKPGGTLELFNKLSTPRKTLHMVNGEHLILEHNQFDDELVEHVTAWLHSNAVPAFARRERTEDAGISAENLAKADAHLKIAEGFLELSELHNAEEHLLQCVQIARGSHIAQQAEYLLCAVPEEDVGAQFKSLAPDDLKFMTHEQALQNNKPTVVLFYADWIVGCKQVEEALTDEMAKFGSRVNFARVDADATANQPIIKRYGIKPIPSLLYLSGDNRVVGYTFGYPGRQAIDAKIRLLLAASSEKP